MAATAVINTGAAADGGKIRQCRAPLRLGYGIAIVAFIRVGEKLLQRFGERKAMIWGASSLRAIELLSRNEPPVVLLEEVRERRVIEQVVRLDGLNLAGRGMRSMRWHGPVTSPAGIPDTLDLAVDPQLVHDLVETFNAGVRDEHAKILRFVGAIWFHSVEDEAGVFAQTDHGHPPHLTCQARVEPALSPWYDYRTGVLAGSAMGPLQ